MGKIAAIDYGLKRIGIALSDEQKKIALPFATIEGGEKAIERIAKTLASQNIELILIGLPLLMSGKKDVMANQVEMFAKKLEESLNIPVQLWDERLSSKGAEQTLRELPLSRKKRSEKLDEVAAMLILQSFLDQKGLKE